jgi:hypothetical protein
MHLYRSLGLLLDHTPSRSDAEDRHTGVNKVDFFLEDEESERFLVQTVAVF